MPNISILWNESAPADSDSASGGAADIRSLKTSLRNALAQEHLWPSSSGLAGSHALGSARAFFAAQSLVSSADTDGRLFVASDTSNFFHVGSAGTMFLGGQRTISANSTPVGGQRFYWATEFGRNTLPAGVGSVTFPNSGFSGSPFVVLSIFTPEATTNRAYAGWFSAISALGFTAQVRKLIGTGAPGAPEDIDIFWYSVGTRTL